MGLYVQSLSNIPLESSREYFIYLLDYGWEEPLGEALSKNYDKMVALAAENNAVIIKGTHRVHFADEVLSWHKINGENAEEILPAILLTNRHPKEFKESFESYENRNFDKDLKLILIPLKKFCNSTTEVVELVEKLFNDIIQKKDLKDFRVSRESKKGFGLALVDSLILEPNIAGVGFNFNNMIKFFTNR
jgi:hypothetical protein